MAELTNISLARGAPSPDIVAVEREIWSGKATFVFTRTTSREIAILPRHIPLVAQLVDDATHLGAGDLVELGDHDHVGGRAWAELLGHHVEGTPGRAFRGWRQRAQQSPRRLARSRPDEPDLHPRLLHF